MTNISPDIFQTHPTVPFDDVMTKHRPVVRCVRGEHRRVMASSGRRRVGGAGRTCTASLAVRSRLRTRMRTKTTMWVALASPSPDGDRPRFESPVTGTGNQSRSVGEEARAFDGALLAGVHRPMQARRRALHRRVASCGKVAPRSFVPSAATRHVDVDVARSSRCRGASLHSPPSFSSSRYFTSVFRARRPPRAAAVAPVQSEVAVQGQERDAHRDVPALEVVAAAMKK